MGNLYRTIPNVQELFRLETVESNKILNSVDSRRFLELGKTLISIPSFKGEETPVANYISKLLKDRGYQVEMQEVEPGRYQTIATLKGTGGGKSLMFNGHIDINPLAAGWKRDPWSPTVEEDRL